MDDCYSKLVVNDICHGSKNDENCLVSVDGAGHVGGNWLALDKKDVINIKSGVHVTRGAQAIYDRMYAQFMQPKLK